MHAQNAANGGLRIYFIDVEGGQSTLFVTPAGRSLLIDTGWPDNNFRDADRIAAAKKARIEPHRFCPYYTFPRGPCRRSASIGPAHSCRQFYVHGPNREFDHGATEQGYAAFQKVLATTKAKEVVAKPGDQAAD